MNRHVERLGRMSVVCDGCGFPRLSNNRRGTWRLSAKADLCGLCVARALAQLEREAAAS